MEVEGVTGLMERVLASRTLLHRESEGRIALGHVQALELAQIYVPFQIRMKGRSCETLDVRLVILNTKASEAT